MGGVISTCLFAMGGLSFSAAAPNERAPEFTGSIDSIFQYSMFSRVHQVPASAWKCSAAHFTIRNFGLRLRLCGGRRSVPARFYESAGGLADGPGQSPAPAAGRAPPCSRQGRLRHGNAGDVTESPAPDARTPGRRRTPPETYPVRRIGF